MAVATRTRPKATKADARYTPKGTPEEHCGICSHYDRPLCERVQGAVVAGGWCKFFRRQQHGDLR